MLLYLRFTQTAVKITIISDRIFYRTSKDPYMQLDQCFTLSIVKITVINIGWNLCTEQEWICAAS